MKSLRPKCYPVPLIFGYFSPLCFLPEAFRHFLFQPVFPQFSPCSIPQFSFPASFPAVFSQQHTFFFFSRQFSRSFLPSAYRYFLHASFPAVFSLKHNAIFFSRQFSRSFLPAASAIFFSRQFSRSFLLAACRHFLSRQFSCIFYLRHDLFSFPASFPLFSAAFYTWFSAVFGQFTSTYSLPAIFLPTACQNLLSFEFPELSSPQYFH